MDALRLTETWPVPHVAGAYVRWPDGSTGAGGGPAATGKHVGEIDRPFPIASISKLLSAWAVMVAVEEGVIALDQPLGQPGCTVRHLLAHAGGYASESEPISRPGVRRIYGNTAMEMVAAEIERAAGLPFADYLQDGVIEPLGLASTRLEGSPAHGITSTVSDLLVFIAEVHAPRLLAPATVSAMTTVQFPELAGVVPGFGRHQPCPWGLGFEIRGDKQPHWTGTGNGPGTFGHFGASGTLLWMDPHTDVACVVLTDRDFLDWAEDARRLWPALADAVLVEALG